MLKMTSLRLLYDKISCVNYSLLRSGTTSGKMVTLAASDLDILEFVGYLIVIGADAVLIVVSTVVLGFFVGLATLAFIVTI
jgi:hypothetical protein